MTDQCHFNVQCPNEQSLHTLPAMLSCLMLQGEARDGNIFVKSEGEKAATEISAVSMTSLVTFPFAGQGFTPQKGTVQN